MNPDISNQLRDIHLPANVSWWPPAPGWWLLAALVIAIVVLALVARRWKRHQKLSLKRAALARLNELERDYSKSQDATAFARGASILLRRVAVAAFPERNVAGLTGLPWLEFLDSVVPKPCFTTDLGRMLITLPYQPRQAGDAEALAKMIREWLANVPERNRGAQRGTPHV